MGDLAVQYRESFDNMVRLVGKMYDAEILVEVGTDDTAGFTLMRELELDGPVSKPPPRWPMRPSGPRAS